MKTSHLISRNHVLSLARTISAVTLLSAAAAMAFVAVKTSTSNSHAKTSASHLNMLRRDLLETSLGVTRSGEPEAGTKISEAIKKIHNGRAQQLYDDRAYP